VDALPQHSHSHSVVFESDPILSPEEAKRELYTSRVRDEPLPNAMARPGQAQTPGGEGEEVHMDATLGRPRYDLGSAARPEYHGELSMFDDSGTRPTAPASPRFSTSPDTWTEERLRAAARLRHRYATADEAEQWLDSYFTWASPVYAVVHRPIFIRKSVSLFLLTPRRHGPRRPVLSQPA
jgi:hypothetical protein